MKQRDFRQLEDFRPLRPEELPPPDPDMRASAVLFAKFVIVYLAAFTIIVSLAWLAPAIAHLVRTVWP